MEVQVVSVYSSTPASARGGPAIADTDRELQRQPKAIEQPAVPSAAGTRGPRRSNSAQPERNRLGLSAGATGARAAALTGGGWARATGRESSFSSSAITVGVGAPTSPRSGAGRQVGGSMALPAPASPGSSQVLSVQSRSALRALSADADRGISKSLLMTSGQRLRPSLTTSGRPSQAPSSSPNVGAPATIWTPRDGPATNGVQHRQPWQSPNTTVAAARSSRQLAKQCLNNMGQNICALRGELDSLKAREATVSRQLTSNAAQPIADIR